jgi:hypothetical protein
LFTCTEFALKSRASETAGEWPPAASVQAAPRDRPAPIDQRLLALPRARESSVGADTFEALRVYRQAITGFVVRENPLCYDGPS